MVKFTCFDKDMWVLTKILKDTDINILYVVSNIIKMKTTAHKECKDKF
jgi:hypothetical protein